MKDLVAPDEHEPPDSLTRPRGRTGLALCAKAAVALIVAYGIQKSLTAAWHELSQQKLNVDFAWLVACGVFYLAGLIPAALYWHWLMQTLGQPVPRFAAFRAHSIGHLGKYVPGKAMVFVLRIGLLPAANRNVISASLAVFYETINLMSVGATLGAILLMTSFAVSKSLVIAVVAMALVSASATFPPVLSGLGRWALRLRPQWSIGAELTKIGYRHFVVGWCVSLLVWLCWGLSFWANLRALLPAEQVPLSEFPFYLASISLAVVAGFASMIPAGVFVREAVLLELLDTHYPAGTALVAAVMIRAVWLLSELFLSVILYGMGRKIS